VGIIDMYPTYEGGKFMEVVVYANYIGLCRFYQYVVNISRWSPYEGGQLDRFYCINKYQSYEVPSLLTGFEFTGFLPCDIISWKDQL